MTDRDQLQGLLARVLTVTGPHRELCGEIAKAFGWELLMLHGMWRAPDGLAKTETLEGLPYFTRSLNAAEFFMGREPVKWVGPLRFIDLKHADAITREKMH